MNEAGGDKTLADKILEFFKAAAQDPSLIELYRKEGVDYLRREWRFTDDDIASICGSSKPTVVSMTVLPQPPIVYPEPHTVLPGKPCS
jgi:hypothetical protein